MPPVVEEPSGLHHSRCKLKFSNQIENLPYDFKISRAFAAHYVCKRGYDEFVSTIWKDRNAAGISNCLQRYGDGADFRGCRSPGSGSIQGADRITRRYARKAGLRDDSPPVAGGVSCERSEIQDRSSH